MLVRSDSNLVRFLLVVIVVLSWLYVLLHFIFLQLLLMMCILVGLLLIIELFIISKHLRGEYVDILIDNPRGMEEVDERFLLLIESLRDVVHGVG